MGNLISKREKPINIGIPQEVIEDVIFSFLEPKEINCFSAAIRKPVSEECKKMVLKRNHMSYGEHWVLRDRMGKIMKKREKLVDKMIEIMTLEWYLPQERITKQNMTEEKKIMIQRMKAFFPLISNQETDQFLADTEVFSVRGNPNWHKDLKECFEKQKTFEGRRMVMIRFIHDNFADYLFHHVPEFNFDHRSDPVTDIIPDFF